MPTKNVIKNIPSEEKINIIDEAITTLFKTSMEKDEAEYICAIKYFKGFNSLHVKTPINELYETVTQSMDFSQTYLKNPDFVAKQLSFVYCQIFETSNWLDLIINLLRIIDGDCVSANPFKKEVTTDKIEQNLNTILLIIQSDKKNIQKVESIHPLINYVTNPNTSIQTKIRRIRKLSKKHSLKIGDIIHQLYNNEFRNDFTHSQYVIYKNHLNLFKAQKNIGFDDLFDILLSVLNLFLLTMNLVQEEIDEIVNKKSKTYKGKCGTVTVEIDGDSLRQSSKMMCANF